MLTKFITAAIGVLIALMVVRFIAQRAHRAQLKHQAEARQRKQAARQARPNMVTTLEVDPDTGVYRPKG